MQDSPKYENLVDELLQFFGEKVHQLRKLGVNDIIIDPGFGFVKTKEQKEKALELARSVPNVVKVIDNIRVKSP